MGETTPDTKDADRRDGATDADEKKPITDPAERERRTSELLTRTRRLVRYLEDEKMIDQKVVDYLKRTSKTERRFGEIFSTEDPQRADRFVSVTRSARVSLQKSLGSLLDQKRLRAAQREDCPAKYRKLVNDYFEALSGGKTE